MVGGKNLLYYLPLTIAESLSYFKAEGLNLTIADFAGGSRALQAEIGNSTDVVSVAFEHTLNMQVKGQRLRASCSKAGRRRSCSASIRRRCPDSRTSPS